MTSDLVLKDGPHDGVVLLTLNRPDKKNALSVAVRDAVSDALDTISDDDATSVVILTGAGDTFSAGFDLKEFEIEDADFQAKLWESSDRFHTACLRFPLPLVAAVNGAALAGGFDLAVMCDLRVAAREAYFAHPELSFAEVVYGPLHDLIGGGLAREIALTGRRVDADEAYRIGLVNSLADRSELMEEARRVAGRIAAAPRSILARMKQKIIRRADVATGPTLDL